MRLFDLAVTVFLVASASWTHAYIPAQGTNDTSGVPDPSDTNSTVLLRWTDQGTYQEGVNQQLTRDGGSPGIEKVTRSCVCYFGVTVRSNPQSCRPQGALVHFWENRTYFNPGAVQRSTTPWIALVDCDRNATDASQ